MCYVVVASPYAMRTATAVQLYGSIVYSIPVQLYEKSDHLYSFQAFTFQAFTFQACTFQACTNQAIGPGGVRVRTVDLGRVLVLGQVALDPCSEPLVKPVAGRGSPGARVARIVAVRCAHATSMLLDIRSKCMSRARARVWRLRSCIWKMEVKGSTE